MQAQQTILTAQNISIARDGKTLLQNLNFSLNASQVFHLKGKNGIGKTSLLKSILGILPPTCGTFTFAQDSLNPKHLNATSIFIGHELSLRGELSTEETIAYFLDLCQIQTPNASLKKAEKNRRIEDILQKFELIQNRQTRVINLSAGQKRRLNLTRLVIFSSKLWILDEAFSNLDAQATLLLQNLIAEQLQNGGAVIITSHFDLPNLTNLQTLNLDEYAI